MPDDQFILFIPNKTEDPNDEVKNKRDRATNWREVEQWANRNPYVYRGVRTTVINKLTDGLATDLILTAAETTYDPYKAYDNTTGIFTSKVRAIYDFYLKLAVSANPSMTIQVSLVNAGVTGLFGIYDVQSKHFHDTPTWHALDKNFAVNIMGLTLNIGERAKFQIQAFADLTTTTYDLTFRKFIRRHSSYPGSTQ